MFRVRALFPRARLGVVDFNGKTYWKAFSVAISYVSFSAAFPLWLHKDICLEIKCTRKDFFWINERCARVCVCVFRIEWENRRHWTWFFTIMILVSHSARSDRIELRRSMYFALHSFQHNSTDEYRVIFWSKPQESVLIHNSKPHHQLGKRVPHKFEAANGN